jgi:hypothetical protein
VVEERSVLAKGELIHNFAALRDRLKVALSGGNSESDDEQGPSAFGLADKIKALKSANTIEATPQRVRQKHSTAEEPVTARIRRRTEAIPASAPAIQPEASAPGAGETLPPAALKDSLSKPAMSFQERIAMERRRKEPEPTLS